MDIIIFAGQSNMQGSTGEKDSSPSIKNAVEYRYLTDSFKPLCNPVGEDIGNDVLCASALGNGSLVPAFCAEYTKTGKTVVAIHVAKGNTSIEEWQKGTERFATLVKKIKAGIEKTKKDHIIGKTFFVWLQGESDALKFTDADKYLKMLIQLKNDLKTEFDIDKFAIIKTGYFAEYAPWINKSSKEKRASDERIMRAFDLACKFDSDFCILTNICKKLSVNKKYLNPKEYGPHYNNRAMKIIGAKAGKQLLKYN